MTKLKSVIIILGCFLLIDCLKEENTDVTITLNGFYTEYIAKKATVVIYTMSSTQDFNIIDTSKKVRFQLSLTNGENSYSVGCGFFRAKEENLFIFCNVDEEMPAGNYTFNLDGIQPITYEGFTITLVGGRSTKFQKFDISMNDLYSDKQSITVVEGKDTYELRFKIYSYNQDPIFVNYNLLIDCTQENNELVCPITRKQLDAILTKSESGLYICYTSYISEGERFPLIPKIDVIYEATQKTDVYVGITKLIEGVCESDTMIAYKTNVTDIDNVFTDLEDDFQLEFFDGTKTTEQNCVFRKYVDNPLLILCFVYNDGTNWLKEITQEKVYNNLNVKYNFRIQPVNNEETIIDKNDASGTFIYRVAPEVLDFTKIESLTIEYALKHPETLRGLTFNEDATDLSCKIIGREIKRCTVPKSHFEGKQSGYYFLKHENHLGGKSTCYEGIPIKVILDDSPSPTSEPSDEPTDKSNMNSFILAYSLILILLMV